MQEDFQKEELEYQKALIVAKERIKGLETELKVLTEVHEEFKQHYEKLSKEYNDRGKKLMDMLGEKKTIEETYEAHMKHIRVLLEEKEKELQEYQSKSISLSDAEILKSKLSREIEIQYKQKMDLLHQDLIKIEGEVLLFIIYIAY